MQTDSLSINKKHYNDCKQNYKSLKTSLTGGGGLAFLVLFAPKDMFASNGLDFGIVMLVAMYEKDKNIYLELPGGLKDKDDQADFITAKSKFESKTGIELPHMDTDNKKKVRSIKSGNVTYFYGFIDSCPIMKNETHVATGAGDTTYKRIECIDLEELQERQMSYVTRTSLKQIINIPVVNDYIESYMDVLRNRQPAQPFQPFQAPQLPKPPKPAQPFKPPQPAQPFQAPQLPKPPKPAQPFQPPQPAQPLQPFQPPQPFQPKPQQKNGQLQLADKNKELRDDYSDIVTPETFNKFKIFLGWLKTGTVPNEKGKMVQFYSLRDDDYKTMAPVVQSWEMFVYDVCKCHSLIEKLTKDDEDSVMGPWKKARYMNNDYQSFKKYGEEFRKAKRGVIPILEYVISHCKKYQQ